MKQRRSERPLSYTDFRTGLSYGEVYRMIWSRRWKRRHGVLGKWREIKQAMYRRYLDEHPSRQRPQRPRTLRNSRFRGRAAPRDPRTLSDA